ncbi:MAG: hypothetical protein MJ177_00215 [Clostridia bacterium]|nr:hypothetical protein [Clostridia bacterium]
MLGKLIKHEFKQTGHSVLAIYCVALATIGFMLLSYLTNITWMGVLGSVLLIGAGGLAVLMTLVAVVTNFQRSLYSNQGYLTFTLPVKCSTLLLSKIIVSAIWIIISYAAFMACFAVVYFYAKVKANGVGDGIVSMIGDFELLSMLPSKALVIKLLVLIAIGGLLSVITFIGYVYFAVTIGNIRQFQGHPMIASIAIFLAVYGVVQGFAAKLTYSFPLSLAVSEDTVKLSFISMDGAYTEGMMFALGAGGIIFTALVALVLFFITGKIMENKVNIK